jgi:hypothetical protein
MKIFAMAAVAAIGLAFMTPGAAKADTDQQNLVDQARITTISGPTENSAPLRNFCAKPVRC